MFAPLVETEHAAAAARLAALLALRGRPSGAITVVQARAAVSAARAAGLPGGAARMADVAFAAGAGMALREAGRRVPSRLSGPRSRTAERSSCSPRSGPYGVDGDIAVYAV